MKTLIQKTVVAGIALCLGFSAALAQTANDTATFEGLLPDADTNWHGDTPGISYFQSGAFKFANDFDGSFWRGVAYANIATSEFIENLGYLGYGNQYKNVAGGGAQGSASYAVLYDTAWILYAGEAESDTAGVRLSGCYMTNNVMLYHVAMNGDDFAGEPFKTGDFFKAVITGFSPQGDTKRVDFYLADYRDEDTAKHYILTDWEWVDLRALGKISRLSIAFEGSRVGQFGLNLPAYAALDNLCVDTTSTGNNDTPGDDDEPTGVEDFSAAWFKLYPVPAQEVLHVETQQENCLAEIFSVQGRKMAEHRLAGTHSILSLQALVPGVYLLRLTCGTRVSTSRFVVGR